MDINKILFEQLNNKEIQNIFNVEDVNTADAVQKESVGENSELKKEISSALNVDDETSSLQIGNKKGSEKLNSAVLNTQNLMNMLSSETQRYNKEEKEIEKEIQSKSEEYQKLAEEIQAKQEEYEKLISEAESSNDESVISNANSLGEEINSMVNDLESIKTNIQNLETSLASKKSISNMFNSQLNSLSKIQSKLSSESVDKTGSKILNDSIGQNNKINKNTMPLSEELSEQLKSSYKVRQESLGRLTEKGYQRQHQVSFTEDQYYGGRSNEEKGAYETAYQDLWYYDFRSEIDSFEKLNSIPDELDLDGDGSVNEEEKYYIKNLKISSYFGLTSTTEATSIDDVIAKVNFLENNPEIAAIEQDLNQLLKERQNASTGAFVYAQQFIREKYDFSCILRTSNNFLKCTENYRYNELFGTGDYTEKMQNQINYNDYANAYGRKISGSNLTEQEYKEILDKINSVSSQSQTQLAELKKTVEQKLANIK